jgi:hypothetical protein
MSIGFSVCVGRGVVISPPFENQDGLLKSVELRILMFWRKTMSYPPSYPLNVTADSPNVNFQKDQKTLTTVIKWIKGPA